MNILKKSCIEAKKNKRDTVIENDIYKIITDLIEKNPQEMVDYLRFGEPS